MGDMTLQEAAQTFRVAGLDPALLEGQDSAFERCVEFFKPIVKTKKPQGPGSYRLKHFIENPSGRFGIPSSVPSYTQYIYEGTCILAACAAGFSMRQAGRHLGAIFNISERSLRNRMRGLCGFRTRGEEALRD